MRSDRRTAAAAAVKGYVARVSPVSAVLKEALAVVETLRARKAAAPATRRFALDDNDKFNTHKQSPPK